MHLQQFRSARPLSVTCWRMLSEGQPHARQAEMAWQADSLALQSGLADIKGWAAYMGSSWCGEPSDTERALEHSHQAVRYLLSGKDDCVRKATKVG